MQHRRRPEPPDLVERLDILASRRMEDGMGAFLELADGGLLRALPSGTVERLAVESAPDGTYTLADSGTVSIESGRVVALTGRLAAAAAYIPTP
jgi:hypothetical protein